jgi:hypothetical protein
MDGKLGSMSGMVREAIDTRPSTPKKAELVYGYTHIPSDTSLWSLSRPDSVLGLLGEKQINRLGK